MSIGALVISYRARDDAKRSADAAQSIDHMARTPRLSVKLVDPAQYPSTIAIYSVRNEGPEDLGSVQVYRPVTDNRVEYPLAITGVTNWLDVIDVGPLRVGEQRKFSLSCGNAESLPPLHVRVECRGTDPASDAWTLSWQLIDPRTRP